MARHSQNSKHFTKYNIPPSWMWLLPSILESANNSLGPSLTGSSGATSSTGQSEEDAWAVGTSSHGIKPAAHN